MADILLHSFQCDVILCRAQAVMEGLIPTMLISPIATHVRVMNTSQARTLSHLHVLHKFIRYS